MNLLNELKRRNVFKVAGVYAVVAWLLMQLASTLEDSLNLPLWFDSVITASLLIGFPIAILLAWAFEMTPEGVRKTETDSELFKDSSSQWFEVAVVIGLIAVISLSVLQYFKQPEPIESPVATNQPTETTLSEQTLPILEVKQVTANSIAVLPFKDLSPNGDQEYFSDGIAEEILNVLVRVDVLQVTSRTSAFQFKDSKKGIPEIAKHLKVRHVLEGSVRKSGETLRITAQLIDAQNDKHLWSETYDRPLTVENIFAIQDEISNAIVQALSSELGIVSNDIIDIKPATNNLSAYELYLKASPLFLARIDLDVADEYLAQALELDPMYAKVWEMRAALQLLKIDYSYSSMTIDEAETLTEQFALKAIELEPNSALALATLALLRANATESLRRTYKIADTIDLYTKAITIDSKMATTYLWRGLSYVSIGLLDKSINDFQQCLNLEPLYSPCNTNLATIEYFRNNGELSSELFMESLNNNSLNLNFIDLGWMIENNQEYLFKVILGQKSNLGGWRRFDELYQAYFHPEQNHSQLIGDIMVFAKKQNIISTRNLSGILVPIGAYELVPNTSTMWGPTHKGYRKSKEFKSYIKQSGVYEYWLDKGFPPQCRPLGEDDFECD